MDEFTLTFAKPECCRCERGDVPLRYDGDGRLACEECLPILARYAEEQRRWEEEAAAARSGLKRIPAETLASAG